MVSFSAFLSLLAQPMLIVMARNATVPEVLPVSFYTATNLK